MSLVHLLAAALLEDWAARCFWPKVRKAVARHLCWLWKRAKNSDKYPNIRVGDHWSLAYYVSHQLCVGPIPEGLEMAHKCHVRHCVRPSHVRPRTHAENMAEGQPNRRRRPLSEPTTPPTPGFIGDPVPLFLPFPSH